MSNHLGLEEPLADEPCVVRFVSELRQLSRSAVSPVEQFGKQIEGVGG